MKMYLEREYESESGGRGFGRNKREYRVNVRRAWLSDGPTVTTNQSQEDVTFKPTVNTNQSQEGVALGQNKLNNGGRSFRTDQP